MNRQALIVARRELLERVRSRVFLISTCVLAVVALLMGLAPIGIRYLDRDAVTRIGVHADDQSIESGAILELDTLLNGLAASGTATGPSPGPNSSPGSSAPAGSPARRAFSVRSEPDVEAARGAVQRGALQGLLIIHGTGRTGLGFEYVTNASPTGRQVFLVRAAALTFAFRRSLSAAQLAALAGIRFTATHAAADPAGPRSEQESTSRTILATILIILLFITTMTYGMWVATSVAEEKGSRVMELMLSAVSPTQMLAGKVAGVGSAGLVQYVAILVPALAAIGLQGQIAELVLGEPAAGEGPLVGLSMPTLLAFGVFFLLGYLLYAVLYAAAGSLVSRQDDVQQVAMPMLLLSMIGYLSATVALSSIEAAWVAPASFIPFFSPWLMLARIMVGKVAPWEIGLAIGILVIAILAALWVAARIYRTGVLLYGQRPGLRRVISVAVRGR